MSGQSNRDFEKEKLWRARINEQKLSGLTQSAFCRAEGLKEGRFGYWKKVIEQVDKKSAKHSKSNSESKVVEIATPKPGFIPLTVVNELSKLGKANPNDVNSRLPIKILIAQIQVNFDTEPETIKALVESFKL